MVNSKKNVVKIIIIVLIALVLAWIVYSTYSKYNNEAQAVISKRIGQWIIKVNNTDITEIFAQANTDDTVDVTDPVDFNITGDNIIWYENSTKTTLANKLQPGGCGYFSIVIDPTGTETSIEYSVTIDQSSLLSRNSGLSISNVTVDGTALTIDDITGDEVEATGRILLSEIQAGRKPEIHVEITWTNNNTRNDSALAGLTISLPTHVNVIQYTGT